jgi:hypothetical protein
MRVQVMVMRSDLIVISAVCEQPASKAASSLGISRMHLWRVLKRMEARAVDPSAIRELRRRRSEIAMSELNGAELRNAVGLFGNESALRR